MIPRAVGLTHGKGQRRGAVGLVPLDQDLHGVLQGPGLGHQRVIQVLRGDQFILRLGPLPGLGSPADLECDGGNGWGHRHLIPVSGAVHRQRPCVLDLPHPHELGRSRSLLLPGQVGPDLVLGEFDLFQFQRVVGLEHDAGDMARRDLFPRVGEAAPEQGKQLPNGLHAASAHNDGLPIRAQDNRMDQPAGGNGARKLHHLLAVKSLALAVVWDGERGGQDVSLARGNGWDGGH